MYTCCMCGRGEVGMDAVYFTEVYIENPAIQWMSKVSIAMGTCISL